MYIYCKSNKIADSRRKYFDKIVKAMELLISANQKYFDKIVKAMELLI
jgi:hypothetical protein